jgi:hypothetical protein
VSKEQRFPFDSNAMPNLKLMKSCGDYNDRRVNNFYSPIPPIPQGTLSYEFTTRCENLATPLTFSCRICQRL